MCLNRGASGRVAAVFVGLLLVSVLSACGDGNDSARVDEKSAPGPLAIQTQSGEVAGVRENAMRKFLGIPYAAPPVGKLRWKPPRPPEPWSKPLKADAFAPFCPQTAAFGTPSDTEDCLYLNVYAPDDNKTHPVMVWIYGGGFTSGASNLYDPARFVQRGVIVVTFNYRLGVLGLLALPALAEESESGNDAGNYSLLDQQAALRWVERNIARFGGNLNNVTLFGESAGGLSVLSQLVSPAAKGLFQKAIVESGSYAPKVKTLAQGEAQGREFAKKVDCPDASLSCLRKVPVKTILKTQGGLLSGLGPKAGTTTLPHNLLAAFESGNFHIGDPVILGTNRNEVRLFTAMQYDVANSPLTPAQYRENEPKAVRDVYPLKDFGGSADLAFSAVGTDSTFACPGRRILEAMAGHGARTYAYEFNDPEAPSLLALFLPEDKVTFPLGATHAAEIPYLFDFSALLKLLPDADLKLTPAQQQLSAHMVDYWTQFARTGNPNPSSGSAPSWPGYDSASRRYLSLQRPKPKPISGFSSEHHCAFWDQRG